MSPAPASLSKLIDAGRRLVRRDTVIAILAAVVTVVPVALLFAWLIGPRAPWLAPSPAPLLLELGALLVMGAIAFLATRRWLRGLDEPELAADAERRLGLPAGAVRGILELGRSVPDGTSPALFRREEAEIARHFAGHSPRQVSGDIGRQVRVRKAIALAALVILSIAVGTLGFVSPERTQASWQPLLNPVAHLSPPPLPPLEVSPGDAEVLRGSDLSLIVRAPGRSAVVIASRAEGDILRRQTVQVTADSAVGTIPRIDANTVYWIEAPDGAHSPTYRVTPLDPLLLSELTVEVVYPAYVGQTSERFDTEVPPLEVPEGTQLIFRGRATRPLDEAALLRAGGEGRIGFTVQEETFSGRWVPTTSGVYEWRLTGGDGTALASGPPPVELKVIADVPPQVEITFPGTDTVLDPGMVQPIAADARDDYGLTAGELVSWRVSAAGATEPAVSTPVQLHTEEDRALIRTALDASARNLVAGDTLKYFLRVTDNSPRSQTGVSRTYALWLPSMAEMRERTGQDAEELVERTEELARRAAELQKNTRDLERRTQASNARRAQSGTGGTPGSQQAMDFQDSEHARQVLEQQERLAEQLEQLRQQMEAFERAMAAAGLRDEALQERMQQLRELYEQALTPELRDQMEQLRQALEKLDPEEVQKALEQLNQQQENLREQLEQSLDMMERAAAEQAMNALAQQAKELATQQEAVADAMEQDPQNASEQADNQKELEKRAEELAEAMAELQQKLDAQGQEQASEQTAGAREQAGEAEKQMEQAAQQAEQKQGEQAAQNGKQAAEKLSEAARQLEQARETMANGNEQQLQESLQQAMNDALSLAQRQQQLLEKMEEQQSDPAGQQLPKPPQPPQAGQQSGQQQSGQQGQQQAGQQQGGQQGQQQSGQQQGGQQQGGQQQGGQQQGGQQQGAQQSGQQGGDQGAGGLEGMRQEQAALQQGLEQLGRNLTETAEQNAQMNRDVGSALGRANLSMQQTMKGLEQAATQQRMPTQEAAQTVEALNRLALALLNQQQSQQSQQQGDGTQQMLQQLSQLAKQQGSLNGQSSALMPLNLNRQAMSQQMNRLAQEQHDIASKLQGMHESSRGIENPLGRLDAMAREAEDIAQQLRGGRLPPEVLARQERLFHRLLDAGRTLEQEEVSDERVGEAPGAIDPSRAGPLDPRLLDDGKRYPVPTPDELRGLPPATRRLILDYFERLNRQPPAGEAGRTGR